MIESSTRPVRFARARARVKTARVQVLESGIVVDSDLNLSLDGWALVPPLASVLVTQGRSLEHCSGRLGLRVHWRRGQ